MGKGQGLLLTMGAQPPYPLTGIIKIREHLLPDKPASSDACGNSRFCHSVNRVPLSRRLDIFIPKVFGVLGGFFQKALYSLDLFPYSSRKSSPEKRMTMLCWRESKREETRSV